VSLCAAPRVEAKGGSPVTVTITAAVSGTLVEGVVTIANGSSKALAVASITGGLEARYPTGYPAPALPPGQTSGYYTVASAALPPPASIPALGTVTVRYSIDVCSGAVADYRGAKDMRSVALVVVGADSAAARSANFAAPSRLACPVCGNSIREGNEQCDGGGCCSASCTLLANGTSCSDGNACTATDTCQSGVCRGGNAVVCSAFDQCHDAGVCNSLTGTCTNPARANGSACNDGNPCSLGDVCSNGQCLGTPLACDDGNVCTTDTCSAGSCVHANNQAPCDDGLICTAGDTCAEGACVGGAALDCDDFQACTDDACAEDVACTHAPTAVCAGCFEDECLLCHEECTRDHGACDDGCWAGFFACLNGCTSTYCAPFCQFDLGRCLDACPAEDTCFAACDAGNGCAADCAQP
jgi:hypothetical protein